MKLRLTAASQNDLARIHEESLKILAETGCIFDSNDALQMLQKHGVKVEGRKAYFNQKQIESAIENVPSQFDWQARNHQMSTAIGTDGFRLAPNAGCVYVQDLDRGRRLAKLEDVGKIQTIHQLSEVTDFVGNNPCDPSDVETEKKHLYITYETLKHTDKPLVSYFGSHPGQPEQTLEMLKIAFGDPEILKKHHIIATSTVTTSPLTYAKGVLEVMTAFARNNQIIGITPAMMGGLTGPLDLLGIALTTNAELLAGTAFIQMVNPGTPVIWTPSSTVGWMKTATYSTGTPEAMLPNIVGLQLANDLYKIPSRNMAGLTDAKSVDCQAGYETMQNLMMAMLGGAHIIYEALGVLDNIMTTSYEKIIIDEELYRRGARICQGLDTAPQQWPTPLIQDVGCGGEFLTHPTTFENCRHTWKPTVSNWDNYEQWENNGREDVVMRANRIWKQRLAQAPETFLPPEIDKDLKAYVDAHR